MNLERIKKMSREKEEFERLAEIAREYIYEYGTPHTTVIVTQTGIEVLDGRQAKPFVFPSYNSKDTPKPLVQERVEGEDVLVCPACYSRKPYLDESNYCGDCGQAISRI
jgi:hypothetical protein